MERPESPADFTSTFAYIYTPLASNRMIMQSFALIRERIPFGFRNFRFHRTQLGVVGDATIAVLGIVPECEPW